ncbi:MAG: CapA family protein, partial [bacterium]
GDPIWPFIQVGKIMQESDLTYINLESPLIANCPVTAVGMKFCGSAQNITGLVWAGVDVASLANNHATNYGSTGLDETVQILQKNGIAVTGVGSPAVVTKNTISVSFVSFDDVSRSVALKELIKQIGDARAISDLVVVTFHWGAEYQSTPTTRQVTLAHTAIQAGADLVIGAHPHWVQSHELYQGKPIYYSLGNFVFDQDWSEETKKGLVVRFTYQGSNLVNTEELPVYIRDFGQPFWVNSD